MGILARDITWLSRNTGYSYGTDYVKSGSSLDILGGSMGSSENTLTAKFVASVPLCHCFV